MTNIRPFRPIPPGEILQEELEARGWTQADLAEILDRPAQAISEIITGKKAITPETALAFAQAFETSAEYWLNLESAYRLDLLTKRRTNGGDISRRSRLYTIAPVKELIRRGWIDVPNPRDIDRLEHEICRFFEIDSINDKPRLPFAARKSQRDEPHNPSQLAWIYRVKHLAEKMRVRAFSPKQLEEAIKQLPRLSQTEKDTSRIPEILARIGVRFVMVDHLPDTRIDGAALWLDEQSPVVALSLRYNRIDCLWFTLMHELAHISVGDANTKLDTNLVGQDSIPIESKSDYEAKADRLAGDWLIPRKALERFIAQMRPYYSRAAILTFSQQVGVHPAIVVGRLQYRGEIPWTHHRNLLDKVRHVFAT